MRAMCHGPGGRAPTVGDLRGDVFVEWRQGDIFFGQAAKISAGSGSVFPMPGAGRLPSAMVVRPVWLISREMPPLGGPSCAPDVVNQALRFACNSAGWVVVAGVCGRAPAFPHGMGWGLLHFGRLVLLERGGPRSRWGGGVGAKGRGPRARSSRLTLSQTAKCAREAAITINGCRAPAAHANSAAVGDRQPAASSTLSMVVPSSWFLRPKSG
jgi:hypothetical protein